MSSVFSQYSPRIQSAARWILTLFIMGKASNSFSTIIPRRLLNLVMTSRTNMRTSMAASSLVSDRNSMRRGMTDEATSGNLMQVECKVRTNS